MHVKENISRAFTEKITNHLYKYYWQELGLRDWESRIQDRINEVARNENILKVVEFFIGSLRDKKVLIVGSGWGGACVAAKNIGADEVLGIDIDEEANEIANLRMQLHGYEECCLRGIAEHIPFANNSFDYVHCFTVLEHVNDVRKSLTEMIRVSKKGAHVFVQAPNYLKPIEKHYKIPYIPLMPKKLAKMYLRLLKRPTNFIGSINYIWPGRVRKILSGISNVEVTDIADEYKRRFSSYVSSGWDYECSATELAQPQERSVGLILRRKAVTRLSSAFYRAWDFVLRTHEIYFLIKKN
jgi:ubiquinone/menaquinone biosynthesis C-methylase UbiE